MNVGKITAKLRDAVPVCFMVEGDEVVRFKNIEMPEALKELAMKDFGFSIQGDGRIDFNIHFEPGILPDTFPEKRARKHRALKVDATDTAQVAEVAEMPEPLVDAEPVAESAAEPEVATEETTEPTMELTTEESTEPSADEQADSETSEVSEPRKARCRPKRAI